MFLKQNWILDISSAKYLFLLKSIFVKSDIKKKTKNAKRVRFQDKFASNCGFVGRNMQFTT